MKLQYFKIKKDLYEDFTHSNSFNHIYHIINFFNIYHNIH